MLQKIDKKNKIYIYLFIFFLLSTFNNIQLVNSNFFQFNIDQIKVSGLSEKNNLQISEEIKNLLKENIFLIKKEFILKVLKKNNLINSFEIKKIYPDKIEVRIKKTKFLAITNVDGNFFFIGSNGRLIDFNESNTNLPYVFVKFINLVEKSKFDLKKIKEIYFFPSGRWDIKTLDNKLFKLPMENIESSFNLIYSIYENEKFKNVKIIDLRFENKIITKNE